MCKEYVIEVQYLVEMEYLIGGFYLLEGVCNFWQVFYISVKKFVDDFV